MNWFHYTKLREEMNLRGMKTSWFAAKIQVNQSTRNRWLTGKAEPSGIYVFRMARILKINPEELITE